MAAGGINGKGTCWLGYPGHCHLNALISGSGWRVKICTF